MHPIAHPPPPSRFRVTARAYGTFVAFDPVSRHKRLTLRACVDLRTPEMPQTRLRKCKNSGQYSRYYQGVEKIPYLTLFRQYPKDFLCQETKTVCATRKITFQDV